MIVYVVVGFSRKSPEEILDAVFSTFEAALEYVNKNRERYNRSNEEPRIKEYEVDSASGYRRIHFA